MFYLMSIHEDYASLILSGKKEVEIRRNTVHMHPGDYVAIYATRPTAQIVGYFVVDYVVSNDRENIWMMFKNKACIARKHYIHYTDGKSIISAIIIKRSISQKGMTIKEMDLWIPQSYSQISEQQFLAICRLDSLPAERKEDDDRIGRKS